MNDVVKMGFEASDMDGVSVPMFSFRRLDWPGLSSMRGGSSRKNRQVVKMVASNSFLFLGMSDCSVLRWNTEGVSNSGEPEDIDISKRAEDVIHHLFLDATGHHLIVALKNGDNYYLHSRTQKPRKVSKLPGRVESVAFDRQYSTDMNSRSILLGTHVGTIHEMVLDTGNGGKEKVCQLVHQLDSNTAITSLFYETVNGDGGGTDGSARFLVMCATSSPTRLYHFYGGPTFVQLFANFSQQGSAPFTEFPGRVDRAELHCYSNRLQDPTNFFALLTQEGMYSGRVSVVRDGSQGRRSDTASAAESNVVIDAKLIPFPSGSALSTASTTVSAVHQPQTGTEDTPSTMSISEFHFLLINAEKTHFRVASRLNGHLLQNDYLSILGGSSGGVGGVNITSLPLGFARDSVRSTSWLYTASSVYQLTSSNEDRYVWKLYLEQALLEGDDSLFDQAYKYCKSKDERDRVCTRQAEFYLKNNKLLKAAMYFAKAATPFDEVVLLLTIPQPVEGGQSSITAATSDSIASAELSASLNVNQPLKLINGIELHALRIYLEEVLKLISSSSKSQRTMVCTWLCEIYLHQITCASLGADPNVSTGSSKVPPTSDRVPTSENDIIAEFKDFLRHNRTVLDQATTVHLIAGRGHRKLQLFYAQIIGDYDTVIGYFVTEHRFSDIIQLLSDAPLERVENILYKTAPTLMQYAPEAAVAMLLSKARLDMSRLLPALLHYCDALDKYTQTHLQLQRALKERSSDMSQAEEDSLAALNQQGSYLNMDFEGNHCNFALIYVKAHIQMCESNNVPVKQMVYHTLVWLLAKYDDAVETDLIQFFEPLMDRLLEDDGLGGSLMDRSSGGMDFSYLLRVCKRLRRRRACVYIYVLLQLPQKAVQMALRIDVELAKRIAHRTTANADDSIKKTTWLAIAQHIIHEPNFDVKDSLSLITASGGVLGIADLLPNLPDFSEIEVFKEVICSTLEDAGGKIDQLKSEMLELSETADSIVKELDSMKKRGYTLSSSQRCEYCTDPLFSKPFYLFPCSHGYHSDCTMKHILSHELPIEPEEIAVIKTLVDQLGKLAIRVKDGDKRAMAQQEILQNELDNHIASDCPLCGSMMIKQVVTPLIHPEVPADAAEVTAWEL